MRLQKNHNAFPLYPNVTEEPFLTAVPNQV